MIFIQCYYKSSNKTPPKSLRLVEISFIFNSPSLFFPTQHQISCRKKQPKCKNVLIKREHTLYETADVHKLGSWNSGPYKRTQTAAFRQAKFYLPWQAVAPQRLVYCSGPLDEPQ